MTVTEKPARKIISGSGWSNPLTFDIYIESSSHIEVWADDELLDLGSDYTVSDVANPAGFSVTITDTGRAPDNFILIHTPPVVQGTDLSGGGVFGSAYMAGLDAVVRRLQAIEDRVRRAVVQTIDTPLDAAQVTIEVGAAGSLLKVDASGNVVSGPNVDTIEGYATSAAASASAASTSAGTASSAASAASASASAASTSAGTASSAASAASTSAGTASSAASAASTSATAASTSATAASTSATAASNSATAAAASAAAAAADAAAIAGDIGTATTAATNAAASATSAATSASAASTSATAAATSASAAAASAAASAAAAAAGAGDIGGAIAAATSTTPADAHDLAVSVGGSLFRTTWATIKSTLKTYFDTLYAAASHVHTFASLTSKPTTLSGYGITDAAKLDTEDQTLTGGARVTSKSLGTITSGTVTPDPGDRPMQHYTNNGAHTLAPGSNTGSYLLDITNDASAGAVTTSGWTKVAGDAFTTTNGHKFRCSCSVGNAGSLLIVQALQ